MSDYLAGDELFWQRLDDMEDCEALNLLRHARSQAVQRRIWLDRNRHEQIGNELHSLEILLVKLNEHITELSTRIDKCHIRKAILELYGEEALHRCTQWCRERREQLIKD